MPVHLSHAEALRLGIITPSEPPPDAEPAITPEAPPSPVDAPIATTPYVLPPTQAYALLSAILRVSGASYGTPQVVRMTGGYAIRASDALAYSVDICTPESILITTHARNQRGRWGVLEARRYPKLTPREFLTLFVTRKD